VIADHGTFSPPRTQREVIGGRGFVFEKNESEQIIGYPFQTIIKTGTVNTTVPGFVANLREGPRVL
jgi:hypothetical protein